RYVYIAAEQAADGSVSSVRDSIEIRRPPVALLHGIWSSKARGFDSAFIATLREGGKRTVVAYDYSATNADHFSVNSSVPYNAAQAALQEERNEGIAATRADLVAHSMAGVLARLYMQDSGTQPFYRPDNYMGGDINRLLTLDTPHFGTPLADILTDMVA